ncbi:iron-containing alcohol dehydrogenase [Endozoicomonas acroporae]|uniref:iron-containing alcohol dehydrogenase n=1 Tax=Endozoicomonas acroporae TaxID=1701104 RepID=UPI0013D68AA4|nr:iron-containing alcohol dehydrogenase [Endozoicomonas acroporae]
MSSQIILPRILQVGEHASLAVADILASMGCSRALIVTDNMMVKLGYVANITKVLEQQHITFDVFSDTVPEPTVASIQAGVEMARAGDYDGMIALGGGSSIDSAKAIAMLAQYGGDMKDYRFPRIVNEPGVPLIAIPTTAGTGSEATRVTIITDETNDEKMLCIGTGFMPLAALVDYTLTISVPARTTADTGIDALTHAIEAYVSKKANAYSDTQAIAAMKLIAPNLRKVYHNGEDQQAREHMMLGSTLAGVAFSNASVALVHGMSRPIGAFFHVPHGLSNAMLLPDVTEYSIPAAPGRYADCARAMGIAAPQDSDQQANKKLLTELKALNEELSVPTPAQFGIDKKEFFSVCPTMAEQALASGSPGNNPRVPSAEELVSMYQALWD